MMKKEIFCIKAPKTAKNCCKLAALIYVQSQRSV